MEMGKREFGGCIIQPSVHIQLEHSSIPDDPLVLGFIGPQQQRASSFTSATRIRDLFIIPTSIATHPPLD
jgi:hypothetical protein